MDVCRYFDSLINFSISNDNKKFKNIEHYFNNGLEELLECHPRIKSIWCKSENGMYYDLEIFVYLPKRELTEEELEIIRDMYLSHAQQLNAICRYNKYFVINKIDNYIKKSKDIEEFEKLFNMYCQQQK